MTTYDATIRFAPLTSVALLNDPKRSKRTMYDRLTFLPGKTSVPVLVDHDDSKEIGRAHLVFPFDDADGRWLVASATLTERPPWLGRGTRASFEYKPLQISSFGDGIVRNGLITEVSVLSPGVEPAEPLAQVMFVKPTEEPKPTVVRKAATSSARQRTGAGYQLKPGETWLSIPPALIRRPGGGILAVR